MKKHSFSSPADLYYTQVVTVIELHFRSNGKDWKDGTIEVI